MLLTQLNHFGERKINCASGRTASRTLTTTLGWSPPCLSRFFPNRIRDANELTTDSDLAHMRSQLLDLGYNVPRRDYSFKEAKPTDPAAHRQDMSRRLVPLADRRFSSSNTAGKGAAYGTSGHANSIQWQTQS